MLSRPPPSRADPFWEAIHGEPRDPLPSLPEFLALQLARGRLCEVSFVEYGGIAYDTEDDVLAFLRQQLWIAEGSPQDEQLRAMLPDHIHDEDGRVEFNWDPGALGIVSWAPPGKRLARARVLLGRRQDDGRELVRPVGGALALLRGRAVRRRALPR